MLLNQTECHVAYTATKYRLLLHRSPHLALWHEVCMIHPDPVRCVPCRLLTSLIADGNMATQCSQTRLVCHLTSTCSHVATHFWFTMLPLHSMSE